MEKFKSDSSFQRVVKNGLFTAIQFLVFTINGILLTPFLLKHYGDSSFGLIALAGFLTQYMGLIAACVANSISRFLNIALNKNDWQQAREIFSTAIVANIGIIILQIPFFILGIWKLHWLIDFPEEIATDFRILVGCNVVIFFVSILNGVISTPIFAANRLDLTSKVSIVGQVMRLVLLFSLVLLCGPRLWIVGAVELAMALFGAAAGYVIYKRLASELVFKLSYVTAKWMRPVLDLAGFMLITSIAHNLFFKTDVWMLNKFVDRGMAGVYAALLIFPNFLHQVVTQITGVVGATYFIDYARNDTERVLRNVVFTEKIIAYCGIGASTIMIFFGEEILTLWLQRPAEPIEGTLLVLFFVTASFSGCADALWRIFQAFNKPKVPGIIALICGVLNIGLSIALIKAGMGVYGVVAGTMVSTFALKAVFQPWYSARLLNSSAWKLWWPIAVSLGVCLFSIGVRYALDAAAWRSFPVSFVYLILVAAGMFFVLFNREDRALTFSSLGRILPLEKFGIRKD